MSRITIVSDRCVDDGWCAYFLAWYDADYVNGTQPSSRLTMRWFSDLPLESWPRFDERRGAIRNETGDAGRSWIDATSFFQDRSLSSSAVIAWTERDYYFKTFRESVKRRLEREKR